MAFLKNSSALVVAPQVDSSAWLGRTSGPRRKIASDALAAVDSTKWLLSHVSIMASVDVEKDVPGDPKKNWRIIPEHSMFVNNNGDAWERSLLARTYGSFLGANNYVEHQQVLSLAKGKVIDVALREVPLGKRLDGTLITTLYVDILIATSWEHADLCQKILSREFNAVSMGCSCKYTICSRCGNLAHDETELCEHVKYFRKQNYYDSDGTTRIIAELCGSADDPTSVVFVDASWVRNPAFPGAVLRTILNPPTPPAGLEVFSPVVGGPQSLESIFYGQPPSKPLVQTPPASSFTPGQDSLLKSLATRVTTHTKHHDTMLKAAADGLDSLSRYSWDVSAADPAVADTAAQETEADKRFSLDDEQQSPPTPDTPADPLGAGDPLGMGGDNAPAADASPEAAQNPPSPEAVDTPLKDITDQVRDNVLNQIKQDLLDSIKDAQGTTVDTTYDNGDDSANLVKYATVATSRKNVDDLMKRKAVDATKVRDRKIAGALLLLNAGHPITRLASFGYTAKDMLCVMDFVNSRRAPTQRVARDIVGYLKSRVDGAPRWRLASSDVDRAKLLVRDFMVIAGRTPSKEEVQILQSWYKLATTLPTR